MSDTFNIKRFGLLFKKTLAERPMQTTGVILLLLILAFILYAAAKAIIGFHPAQNLTLIWGLAGGGFFLASFVFGYFNSNASGCAYLTLPVSHLERWLCGILIVGIIYPAVFLLVFRLIDWGFIQAYHNSLDPTSLFYKQQYESVYTLDLNGIMAWKVYIIFFILTGSMLTGSLYFNKAVFIKTGILVCIVVLGGFGLNWLIADLLFGHVQDAFPFNDVALSVGKETGTLLLPSKIDSLFHYILAYFIPGMLWIVPLIRFREKEF